MAGGSAIRGSRVGAGPMGEAERGEAAPRRYVSFYCSDGHETTPVFLMAGTAPQFTHARQGRHGCGYPAGRDPENPPKPPKIEPYKTHLAYVKERRSSGDGDQILAEALQRVRGEDL